MPRIQLLGMAICPNPPRDDGGRRGGDLANGDLRQSAGRRRGPAWGGRGKYRSAPMRRCCRWRSASIRRLTTGAGGWGRRQWRSTRIRPAMTRASVGGGGAANTDLPRSAAAIDGDMPQSAGQGRGTGGGASPMAICPNPAGDDSGRRGGGRRQWRFARIRRVLTGAGGGGTPWQFVPIRRGTTGVGDGARVYERQDWGRKLPAQQRGKKPRVSGSGGSGSGFGSGTGA